jgi:hypothetical protein
MYMAAHIAREEDRGHQGRPRRDFVRELLGLVRSDKRKIVLAVVARCVAESCFQRCIFDLLRLDLGAQRCDLGAHRLDVSAQRLGFGAQGFELLARFVLPPLGAGERHKNRLLYDT